ncbi:MAG: GIN domain-containing protein [Marinilabiliaceae bacterium]
MTLRPRVLWILSVIVLALALPNPLFAQKSGQKTTTKTTQQRVVPKLFLFDNVDPFSSLCVARRINAEVAMLTDHTQLPSDVATFIKKSKRATQRIQSGKPLCIVRAEPTVAKAVVCQVDDGALSIYANPYKYQRTQRIDVYVLCDSTLRTIRGTMGSNISTRGCLILPQLTLVAQDKMEIHASVRTQNLNVKASNTSIVWVTGEVASLQATVDSASFLRMCQISADNVTVSANAESRAETTANKSLTLKATANSSITYYAPSANISTDAESGSFIDERYIHKNIIINKDSTNVVSIK